jgi:hypothetical protein
MSAAATGRLVALDVSQRQDSNGNRLAAYPATPPMGEEPNQMANRNRSMVLSAASFAAAVGATEPRLPLTELPISEMKRVVPAEYGNASALAGRGGTPLEIALAIAGAFEGSTQHIIQVTDGGEAPSASRITVMRDGLADDSVRSERWDIALARTGAGLWRIVEVKRAWRCWRGEPRDWFATVMCP